MVRQAQQLSNRNAGRVQKLYHTSAGQARLMKSGYFAGLVSFAHSSQVILSTVYYCFSATLNHHWLTLPVPEYLPDRAVNHSGLIADSISARA